MNPYETLTGRLIDISALTPRQRRVMAALHETFDVEPSWDTFSNFWQAAVRPVIGRLVPAARTKHPLYAIGQDMELRLGIKQKKVAPPDYRDYIVDRIEERFGSRYKFCQETGVPQAFLSQVLSGQKDFSLETLRKVADALGLGLALLPIAELAEATRGSDAAALRKAQAQVASELALLECTYDAMKRVKPGKRRSALAKRERFDTFVERVAGRLGKLDDERFGERILPALEHEIERLESLLEGLREQIARVVESGSLGHGGGRSSPSRV